MGWVKIVGKGLEFAGKIAQAEGFEEWLKSSGGALLDKVISDEGLKFFAQYRAKTSLVKDLQKTLATHPSLIAAVNEEVNFFVTHVGTISDKLPSPASTQRIVIVPRIFVSEESCTRLYKELGNSNLLQEVKGGKEMASYFINQLHTQLDEALVQLVSKKKIVPSGRWFIIDVDPSFEWEINRSPRGHFIAVKPYISENLDKDALSKAKQQEEEILARLGKMSRVEIDSLIEQWRARIK